MNRNLVGSIYGYPLWRLLILSQSVNKHGYHRNLVGIIYRCPLWRLLISSRSVSKHGHHMQFLFLIGRFLKNMNRNLVGSIYMYGKFCIKFPQSRMKGERHRLSVLLIFVDIIYVVVKSIWLLVVNGKVLSCLLWK
jgi:hypothetical protein